MKKLSIVGAVCGFMLALSCLAAETNTFAPSKWAVSLGGAGITAGDNIGNDWNWGGELGLARRVDLVLFEKPVRTDLGVRQTFGYGTIGYNKWTTTEEVTPPCTTGTETVTTTHSDQKEGWMFRTELFWDFNIPIYKRFSAFVGPNASVNYGWDQNPAWMIGPEVGFKLGLGKLGKVDTLLFTRVNYDWNLSGSQDAFRVSSGFGFEF